MSEVPHTIVRDLKPLDRIVAATDKQCVPQDRHAYEPALGNRHRGPVDPIIDIEDADLTAGRSEVELVADDLTEVVVSAQPRVWHEAGL